jgi:hypothetical protein
MKVKGNEGLVKIVYKQLRQIIKNYPIISGVGEIDIETDEKCCSYFIRLEIPLKTFEEKIPIYNRDAWEIIKDREIRINGGLYFYTSELEKYSKDSKFRNHYKISDYVFVIINQD